MAIILNLFGQSVWEGLNTTPTDEPTTAPVQVANPCINCYLREVCDSDYCGRRLQ